MLIITAAQYGGRMIMSLRSVSSKVSKLCLKNKNKRQMVEILPSIWKALTSIPTIEREREREREREKDTDRQTERQREKKPGCTSSIIMLGSRYHGGTEPNRCLESLKIQEIWVTFYSYRGHVT
jgi:hypothetical protein